MSEATAFTWTNGYIDVDISYGDNRPPAIERIAAHGTPPAAHHNRCQPQSIVQITADGLMQQNFGSRYSETLVGNDLRYISHREIEGTGERTLEISCESKTYGLEAKVELTAPNDVSALRGRTTIRNVGSNVINLTSVSSISVYLGLGDGNIDGWDIVSGRSDWTAEGRWNREPARDFELVSVLNTSSSSVAGNEIPQTITPYGATMTRCSTSSRSTCSVLPAGAVIDRPSGESVFWQIQAMGPWLWQIGERIDGCYLLLSGPTDIEHHWSQPLAPGESFTTVDAAIAVSTHELDGAMGEMAKYRRHIVRPHRDHNEMPVFFNDYMNTLMGDPTTEAELPLIEAAAAAGAEYYCVDCGWYDDGGDWWPSVGAWQESTKRFPNGLMEVLDHIRACGMKPGIWLEPEVVGIKSPVAKELPDDAFMQRDGKRIQTHLRYHLDLRHPAARKHLDSTVDRLVDDYGIRFFKLDYNINAGAGTSANAPSRGAGLLEAGQAYLDWLDGVLSRHPDLTIETCSSGSMRSDPALLALSQLQSTSDQQDFRAYANVAASAPAIMLPEQCGNWAYPNTTMTIPETRFTMLSGIVGRLYLSGYLTEMTDEQLSEVRRGIEVHKMIRHDIAAALPFWPIGLPRWRDDIVALGLRLEEHAYVALWAKSGIGARIELRADGIPAGMEKVELLYGSELQARWLPEQHRLTLLPTETSSRESPSCALLRFS